MSQITVFKDGESQKITATDLPEWRAEGWQSEDPIVVEQSTTKSLVSDPIILYKDANSVSVARVDLAGWLADGWVAESLIDPSNSTDRTSPPDPVSMQKENTFALVPQVDVEMWISDGWSLTIDPSAPINKESEDAIALPEEPTPVNKLEQVTKKKNTEALL